MSGSAIPYHLRPHKAVDRRLFLDLLAHLERWRPLLDHVYLSMGAYPLEDHKLVHRLLGISKLIAFDFDPDIVARQFFNRPIDTCKCIKKTSGEIISQLDAVLSEHNFEKASGLVVWLDYTDPKKIGEQVREFEALLNRLRVGDVARITVNSHPHAFLEETPDQGKHFQIEEKRKKQFDVLRTRLGEFLPSWASFGHMTALDLPRVLSEALASAALQAMPVSGPNVFVPLSIVRYADGQQMLSVTGVVVPRGEETEMRDKMNLDTWPFASLDWTVIHHLVVPDLTVRERLFLERGIINRSTSDLIAELGFDSASDVRIEEFLESYKDYYRFYPTLLSAEI